MWRTTICGVTLLICLGWCAARGQERAGAPTSARADNDSSRYKRLVYVAKHVTARALADTLARHFKGEDVEVQVLPEGPGNLVLIRTPAAAFAEVAQLLDQLDRRPRLAAVELLVAEVLPPKAEPGQPAVEPLDETQFNGTMEDAQGRINALVKAGRVGTVKRVQVAAVENLASNVLIGENKPFVTSVRTTGTGVKARSIVYRHTGLSVTVTPHFVDNAILLDLRVQDSRPRMPADGIEIGNDEKGPVRATEFLMSTLESKLSITAGRVVLARGVKTTSKSGSDQTLMIVGARLVDPEAGRPAKQPETSPPGKGPRRPKGGVLPSP